MVKKTQKWLNSTYASYEASGRYVEIAEDGETGWGTINGLIRAMQIEMGIEETADNFGSTSEAYFKKLYPNGVAQQADTDTSESNVYGIIQGALWCKGYATGSSEITKHFYDGTGSGIKQLKNDAGITATSSTVTLNVMKALLSMKQFQTYSEDVRILTIRSIQRTLNSKYENYTGLMPCDGIYDRNMNEALIKVLQAIEGYSVEDATGNFGSGTKAGLGDLLLPSSGNAEAMLLARYALYVNGYDVTITSSQWDSDFQSEITQFQRDLALPVTSTVDVNTWMSLFLSKGNTDRSCAACDTRFEMTDDRIAYLVDNGYEIVGRYLTGGDFKELRMGEPQRIIAAGLEFFMIFQESGADSEYFNATNAYLDVNSAIASAERHCIPGGNIIYFAVDFDAQDTTIESMILPYFAALKNRMTAKNSKYKIGVYGTRNVCSQVISAGYAESAFVSDMSTGYSGNMGYKIPSEWNFDQFYEFPVTTASGTWDLDKVAYSGKISAVKTLLSSKDEYTTYANFKEGTDMSYLESVHDIQNGSGSPFTCTATEMALTIDYTCPEAPTDPSYVGIVSLCINGYYDPILQFEVGSGQTNTYYNIPVSYYSVNDPDNNVYILRYQSKLTGVGLTVGDFDVWITTSNL